MSFSQLEPGATAPWHKEKLGNLLIDVRNGLTVPQKREPTGAPITRIETIASGTIDAARVRYVDRSYLSVHRDYVLDDGDILFSHINSESHLGKTAIYEGFPRPLLHGMNLLRLRPDRTRIDPRFLNFLLRYIRGKGIFAGLGSRAVGQASLNQGRLKQLEVSIPPLPEQRAIANVLSTIQRAREAATRELSVSDAFIYSLLDRYLADALEGDRPKLVRLADLVEPDRPICYGILKPGPDIESGIPYVRVVDYPSGQVLVRRLRRTSLQIAHQYRRASLRAGDILVSIRGTYGKVARVPGDLDGANITQDTARVSPSAAIDKDFLLWYLRSRRAQQYMRESATGVAVRGVNIGALRELPVPVLPRDRQKAIAFGVQVASNRHKAVGRHLEAIGQLFDAALSELVSGKREVAR